MDVSRLMILLKEAWSRARDEGVGVYRKAFYSYYYE